MAHEAMPAMRIPFALNQEIAAQVEAFFGDQERTPLITADNFLDNVREYEWEGDNERYIVKDSIDQNGDATVGAIKLYHDDDTGEIKQKTYKLVTKRGMFLVTSVVCVTADGEQLKPIADPTFELQMGSFSSQEDWDEFTEILNQGERQRNGRKSSGILNRLGRVATTLLRKQP